MSMANISVGVDYAVDAIGTLEVPTLDFFIDTF